MKVLACAALMCVLFASGSYAQSDRGTITGTVVDPDGAVVPGASIVAENPENGSRYETVTTQTGNYTIAEVPVGSYNLHVELAASAAIRQTAAPGRRAQGVPTSGFGRINTGTVYGPSRSGQIVTRLSW
jgi:hypothetical protein